MNDVIKAKEMYGITVGPNLPSAAGLVNLHEAGRGARNISRTPDSPVVALPPDGYDAVIGVDPSILKAGVGDAAGRPVSPAKVLFHETAESFERTTHHKQYLPAHATAIRREAIWMQQKPSLLRFAPGAGPIRFYTNRVEKAK